MTIRKKEPAQKLTLVNRNTNTRVEVITFTPERAKEWKIPSFQRPLKVNEKVRALADSIARDGGVLPGILTFGVLEGAQYLVDGQHRREAFLMSGKPDGYADARFMDFDSMAHMADEYVRLNSALVKMSPDDILRGLEPSIDTLKSIRKACPFVGYSASRNTERSPILSMSRTLRSWSMASLDVPAGAKSAVSFVQEMDVTKTNELIAFLTAALDAWGRDLEYERLWSSLNLTLCMWLYKRMVVTSWSAKSTRMDLEMFRLCLVALVNEKYVDWLQGKLLSDIHRAPAYARIATIMKERLSKANWKNVSFPAPDWTKGKKS